MTEIVSTRFAVRGVNCDDDVRKALQSLFDIFADEGLGQATFELTASCTSDLIIKHPRSVTPDARAIDAALGRAGAYHLGGWPGEGGGRACHRMSATHGMLAV